MSMFGLANSYQTYYTVSNLLKQKGDIMTFQEMLEKRLLFTVFLIH